MNEEIAVGQDMYSGGGNEIEQVLRKIMDHALITRPVKQVEYRPYQACKGVNYKKALGAQCVNLDQIHPEAKLGDGVFTDFWIACEGEEEIYLNVSAHVKVWYNQTCIYDGTSVSEKEEMKHLPIKVQAEKKNLVRILCVKKKNHPFSFDFLLSVKRYPTMWANDYLFWARNQIPLKEREGEEGVAISGLLPKEVFESEYAGSFGVDYFWPLKLSQEEIFDFQKLCGKGEVCYVYTEAETDHELEYEGTVKRIKINGKASEDLLGKIPVKAGDRVLFCCEKKDRQWYLKLNTDDVSLSFLQSNRKIGDKAIYVGPFYGNQNHAPEYDWDFSTVFTNEQSEKCYWNFLDGSELRIYLDSVFYGQWFYALMVGFYGIRDAAIFLGDEERQRLFNDNMRMLAKYFSYVEYDLDKHVMSAFMPRLYELNVLDNIGTMGMNLIDSYFDCNDPKLLPLIERITYQAENTIPRFQDGTYHRVTTMWADDLYMSVPFLIRMGRLTGKKEWYEKAEEQILGFKARLYMEKEHLFSHIYFPTQECANKVPWGRGNGWVMWTLSEFLMYAEGKIDTTQVKQLFCEMAEAIKALQGNTGLWRQVLNRKEAESYYETSCTGMFLLAFTRGVYNGWLGEEFLECMDRAWTGLLKCSVDREGNVYGVCMGSGCAMEAEYYYTIPTIMNDDHGTGVVLAAGAEYGMLLKTLEKKGC